MYRNSIDFDDEFERSRSISSIIVAKSRLVLRGFKFDLDSVRFSLRRITTHEKIYLLHNTFTTTTKKHTTRINLIKIKCVEFIEG